MANTNAPFGFRQYSGNGSAPTYEQVAVSVGYNTTNIFYGDPVEPAADGTVAQGDGTTAAAGIAGIFVGCQYLSVAQKRTVWSNYYPGGTDPASGTIIGYIINDPNARFVVQAGASAIGTDALNANIGYDIGAGNTASGISGAFVTAGSIDVTATLPFRVVGLVTQPPGSAGTDYTSGYNWVVVGFNNVTTKNQTGI
jgi:D-serine deaminase-like pyridoxal phosphate-dependent protein